MNRRDAEDLERRLLAEIAKRRSLGGYSPDAGALLMLCEVAYEVVRHLKDRMPRPPKPKDEDDPE